jgi:hypothetical protein
MLSNGIRSISNSLHDSFWKGYDDVKCCHIPKNSWAWACYRAGKDRKRAEEKGVILMKEGDRVICGYINMSRYRSNGGFVRKWFTDREGVLKRLANGVFPRSWYIEVDGKEIMLAEDEFHVI